MSDSLLLEITIWDAEARRIFEIDRNLHLALRALGIRGVTRSISEPPLLARENLLDRVPVLEVEGRYWSLKPGKTISVSECKQLLQKITMNRY